jgi:hypothetical protein
MARICFHHLTQRSGPLTAGHDLTGTVQPGKITGPAPLKCLYLVTSRATLATGALSRPVTCEHRVSGTSVSGSRRAGTITLVAVLDR